MGFLRSERRRIAVALSFIAALAVQGAAWAVEPFKIKEIRAEGLQRLEIGTVLTYLPLSVGDELNRDGDALVIKVKERPEIASFTIKGNDKIGGDELNKSLKDLGLTQGELF